MLMKNYKYPFVILLILLPLLKSYAQDNNLLFLDKTVREEYISKINKSALLFSGKEHIKYPLWIQGDPFYETSDFRSGKLVYDGIEYSGIQMRLDTYTDELVVLVPNDVYHIVPHSDYFTQAVINNILLLYNKDNETMPFFGYYILLYKNALEVLVKPVCSLHEKNDGAKLVQFFRKRDNYYVLMDGKYKLISGKSSLLSLFKTHKKELNQFIKEYDLNYKKDPKDFIVKVVSKYEGLTR